MAKARSLEARLAGMRELRRAPASAQRLADLRIALRDASHLVVAEAAELAGEALLVDLMGDLIAAYERFLIEPQKKDKLCKAKIAIIEALNKLEYAEDEFFLRGIRYVQKEPAWGEPVDTAVPVRVASAFGLVRTRHRGALGLLVDLLVDPEHKARVGAVQALVHSGSEAAALLLRLKARLGDAEPEVISECFTGLVELQAAAAIEFLAEFLASPSEAVQEAALLALGGSRQPEAIEILKSYAERSVGELLEVAHVALALLRLAAASEYLVSVIAREAPAVALSALSALAVHRYDERVREQTAAAVAQNGDPNLLAMFEKRFTGEK